MNLSVIILAAGAGTRMHSALPKVLHKIAGTPMVEHAYNRSKELDAQAIHIVYGHGGELLLKQCEHFEALWSEQKEQLGTAHAVQQASPKIDDEHIALVLYGDVPLLKTETLKKLVSTVSNNDIALLTVNLDDPTGYGRIVRKDGKVIAIVEHKDANVEQLKIDEVNTGILAVRSAYLNKCLEQVSDDNAQGEFYLTDIIEMAVNDGNQVITTQPDHSFEVEGVNDRKQLAKLERIHQQELANAIMADGVTIADPSRIDIRGELNIGNDSFIDVNCVFEGVVNIGTNVSIGAGCVIKDSTIVCDSIIKPYSLIEDAVVGKSAEVGPFARLRPGAELKQNSKVGNFVEMKKTVLGENSKASHLSYLGDCEVGRDVNIGAGTITCNYDGVNKFKTIIEDGAFIGSDSQLVAPVRIGKNATIGAGSTITADTEAEVLTLSRSKQKSVRNWQRPTKK